MLSVICYITIKQTSKFYFKSVVVGFKSKACSIITLLKDSCRFRKTKDICKRRLKIRFKSASFLPIQMLCQNPLLDLQKSKVPIWYIVLKLCFGILQFERLCSISEIWNSEEFIWRSCSSLISLFELCFLNWTTTTEPPLFGYGCTSYASLVRALHHSYKAKPTSG